VQLSRHPARPYTLDYIAALTDDFHELKGDRLYADDPAIVAGLARFDDRPVLVLGQQKGRNTNENVRRNFAMPRPEGYRKAKRLMELAGRYRLPIVSFIDTPGAHPGLGAEERGQAEAIARNLETMAGLPVPVIAVVIGEGGSGGALAIGVANRLLMLQYATYSVISPEGCASILWKDGAQAPRAAEVLRLCADDILRLGVADEVVAEPAGGAHRKPKQAFDTVGEAVRRHLAQLREMDVRTLVEQRYQKYRQIGRYLEV
jgi:acetyl-CoA carboxylase carboxyl transferase subunit alpha